MRLTFTDQYPDKPRVRHFRDGAHACHSVARRMPRPWGGAWRARRRAQARPCARFGLPDPPHGLLRSPTLR